MIWTVQEIRAAAETSKFLEGLDYPISKAELLTAARQAQLGATIQDALAKLPERDYEDREALTRALNAAN